MAESITPRFGFKKQSAGTDAFPGRVGFMEFRDQVESQGAIDLQVANIGARPAAGKVGRYCWVASDSEIGNKPSLWRDNGAAWTRIWPARNVPERGAIMFGPDAQNNPVNVPSVGWYPAGREMKFAYASGGAVQADGDIASHYVGGDVLPIGADLWRPYAPSWITDFIDDPNDARPGLITIAGAVGVYHIRVAITLLADSPAGYWAAGLDTRTFGSASSTSPTFVGPVVNTGDATVDSIVHGSSRTALLTVDHTTSVDGTNSTLEIMPFLYFGSTSTSGGQRQFSSCSVEITRWPGNL